MTGRSKRAFREGHPMNTRIPIVVKEQPSVAGSLTRFALKSVLIGVLLLAGLRVASAQTSGGEASALTHALMSPFCPGLLLADCRSEGARELRAEIARRLEAGEASSAIEADLVRRFGPEIRTVPEFRGLGILAWMGPAMLGVGGFAVLVVAIRSAMGRRPTQEERADDALANKDPAMLERLQDELDDLD